MTKPKVLSLFSGAGGMDLGFIQAGFDVIFANDFDKDACKTYRHNIGDHIIQGDISEIEDKDIPKSDVLIGGFPCQGFSQANNKKYLEDPRNFLYKEMMRFVRVSKPAIIVAENVRGILSFGNGYIVDAIKKDLTDLGYAVEYKLLNSANFGVPQARYRVIIVASKIKGFFFPTEILTFKRITTKQVIGHLADVPITFDPIKKDGKTIFNHIALTNVKGFYMTRKYNINKKDICDYLNGWKALSGISMAKIDTLLGYKNRSNHWFRHGKSGSLPSVEDWKRLKKILKFDDKWDKEMTTLEKRWITFIQDLRVIKWNAPSCTITSRPEIHITRKRRVSVRECAILQTFPDDFVFFGGCRSMHKQVGNAVPVRMAKAIAERIHLELRKS